MVSFPLIKLGALAVRQISKPIVRVIKQTAKTNQTFNTYLVSTPAQIYHWIGVRAKMRMLGMKQPKFVPPLNKTMAIETGSDLLGEMIVFSVCVSLLCLEFSRQARNEKLKQDNHRDQNQKLENEIELLNDRVVSQTYEIKNLKAKLRQLGITSW
ncbi:putative OPA3-like protein CG13603 [Drosophila virilis]|uniref:putative OPA3-like protein CG13603 n=1 Tax=Drosophila virilis TaxID=7244 RepID=UPI0013960971|nr:putative OPA3-like protein CG13603 [Drosophila virilis]